MIERVGAATGTTRASAVRPRGDSRFPSPSADTAPSVSVNDTGLVSLGSVLAMQESEADAVADREATRDGEEMLLALASLQHAMLRAGASPDALARLATLAAQARNPADKGLRSLLDAIGLRVRVELARYHVEVKGLQS